jgi:hypothetical protein
MWIAGAHIVASPLHKYWSLLDVTVRLPALCCYWGAARLPADSSDSEGSRLAGRENRNKHSVKESKRMRERGEGR